nr:immunoglobulin heavy chain junction region [Macaca mulatta]MOX00574.1 immunoglobulin heavy chain junction region [Macaca mulatta]MOX03536.1 immunoglobulin heavy chain junction region [Macaca mulatta]
CTRAPIAVPDRYYVFFEFW